MSETAEKLKLVAPINPNDVRQADHEMQQWLVYAQPDTTAEDIERPAYWALAASNLRAPARMTIMSEDGTWLVDAICVASDRNWAKVVILSSHQLGKAVPVSAGEDMEVKWGAPANKWLVIRKSDREVLSKGHRTRDEAEAWLKSHRAALER